MRNLKSMVAFLVVAAMLFASFTTFAYNDVAADADYAAAVEVLSALEILKGDDKGNFNPDNTITRAEAAAVIVRTLGWEEAAKGAAGATQFTDVAADHWGSGYINMAAQAGIIAGHGDGTFGPEDPVTYEQIVKMLVCALGYEPKALTKGAYPTGYLITANEAKLTAGVSGAAGQEAPRKIVAQLTFNALDIPLMEQEGWGSDVSYVIYNGNRASDYTYKTLLTEKLGIAKVYGTVTNPTYDRAKGLATFTVNDGVGNAKNDKIQLIEPYDVDFADAATVDAYAANVDASAAMNMLAYGYFKAIDSKDADYELIAISKVGAEETVTLNFDEFDYASSKFTWNDEKDEADVDGSTVYYLNGVASSLAVVDDFFDDRAIGSVTLVLNPDAEGDIDYVYVTASVTAVVKEVNVEKARIRLVNSVRLPGAASNVSTIRLDKENDDLLEDLIFSIKDAEGNDVALADLKANDILTIKANGNGDTNYNQGLDIEITVSTASVEGQIVGRKTVDGVTNWKIGDKYYVEALNSGLSLATQDKGIFYLNAQGQIAAVEEIDGAANYVVIYRVKANDDDSYTISAFGKDGEATYTIAAESTVYFGSTKYGAGTGAAGTLAELVEDAMDIDTYMDANTAGTTFKYKYGSALDTNLLYNIEAKADGQITKLSKLTAATGATTDSAVFYASSKSFDKAYFANDATVFFDIPADAETVADFNVVVLADLEDEATYTYFTLPALDADDNATAYADFVVITGSTVGANETNPIAIVIDVATELDEEGDAATAITYLSAGEEVTILGDFDDETTYPVGTVIVLKKTIDGLLASDCSVVGTLADGTQSNGFTLADDLDAATKREVVYGSVYSIDNDLVTLNVVDKTVASYTAGTERLSFMLADVDTYVYDVAKKNTAKFAEGDAYDLEANAHDDVEDTYEFHYAVAVLDDEGNLVNLIILVPEVEKNADGTIDAAVAGDHAGSFTTLAR